MKVLMLGWELPPHNSGGLGVACLQLTKALAKTGADIDFVLPYYPAGAGFDHMNVASAFSKAQKFFSVEHAYDSHKFKLTGEKKQDFNLSDPNLAFEDAVSHIIALGEYDIIHAHDWLTFRAALRAKMESGKPLVVHIHSIERDRAGGNDGNPEVREIEATTMLLADRVVAISERTKKSIIDDYGVPADKITVVHNSMDREFFIPNEGPNAYRYISAMKEHGWKVVVNVGRLTIQKGLPQFITTASEVVKYMPKTLFLIVGSGEQRDELIEQAATLGIGDRVLFTGFQRGKRWRDAFSIGDLFVMPSVSEPFGLTPLEAIAYGCPAIISKQSGVAEILHNCLKVDYWDTNEMANQIVATLQNDALHNELLANSQSEYANLSWSKAASDVMGIYCSHAQGVPA